MKTLILIFLLIGIQVKAQVGMVVPFLGTNCPSGYLKMDQKRDLDTEEYPALFTQAGYTHGGSGSTFSVPNLGGIYIRTAGNSALGPNWNAPLASIRRDAQQNITGTTWGYNGCGCQTNTSTVGGAYRAYSYAGGHNVAGGGGDGGAYLSFDSSRVVRTDSTVHGADITMILCLKVQ